MAYPTNPIYKLVKDPITNTSSVVITMKGTNQLAIPFDDDNSDYIEYKQWVADGNTAEAAS